MTSKPVSSIGERAAADLAYIRGTLASHARFTSVSGAATFVIGMLGVLAAWLATTAADFNRWLTLWLITAALCAVIGGCGMYRKDRRNTRTRNVSLNARFLMSTEDGDYHKRIV